jgi:ankyrin repeat protein
MKAAANGNLEATQALVEAGADVNALNNDGRSAVSLAAEKMPNPCIMYLNMHGARR